MAKKNNATTQMFAEKGADNLYSEVISKARTHMGPQNVVEDQKQTCVHIIAGKGGTAYAGLHPRKGALLLNFRLQSPLKSKRIRKVEQLSRNRYNCEMILSSESEIDDEILGWLTQAWRLASESTSRRKAASAG